MAAGSCGSRRSSTPRARSSSPVEVERFGQRVQERGVRFAVLVRYEQAQRLCRFALSQQRLRIEQRRTALRRRQCMRALQQSPAPPSRRPKHPKAAPRAETPAPRPQFLPSCSARFPAANCRAAFSGSSCATRSRQSSAGSCLPRASRSSDAASVVLDRIRRAPLLLQQQRVTRDSLGRLLRPFQRPRVQRQSLVLVARIAKAVKQHAVVRRRVVHLPQPRVDVSKPLQRLLIARRVVHRGLIGFRRLGQLVPFEVFLGFIQLLVDVNRHSYVSGFSSHWSRTARPRGTGRARHTRPNQMYPSPPPRKSSTAPPLSKPARLSSRARFPLAPACGKLLHPESAPPPQVHAATSQSERSQHGCGLYLQPAINNGPTFHTQLLHHRAHRPRQVHAGRPPARTHRRAHPARDDRAGPRLHGPRARARHHHQGQEHPPALLARRRQRVPAQPHRHARPRGFLLRSLPRSFRLRRRAAGRGRQPGRRSANRRQYLSRRASTISSSFPSSTKSTCPPPSPTK